MNFELIERQGFVLLEQLEETSQTVSWKAIQRTLDRTVILRILKPESAAVPGVLEHFLSIARIVARVKSEAIAAIFDIVSSDDLHYIITEYVDGPNLEELVARDGPLPATRALRIAAALIDGLEQLWESARVVHRNLKSTTVRLNSQGIPKLTDFSLAIPAGPGVNATAMDDGHIVGTPCFLSPEQAQGAHLLTCHADMYALGVVLYHLVSGIVPFEEREVVDILTAHVRESVAPPHTLNKSVPPDFSLFLQHLMMKEPEQRPYNWQSVLRDIRTLLAGTPLTPPPPQEGVFSTIATFDESTGTLADTPQIRFKKMPRKSRFGRTSADSIIDEHAQELRRERLLKEMLGWLILLVWLVVLFWYRAIYQDTTEFEAPDGGEAVGYEEVIKEFNYHAPRPDDTTAEVVTSEDAVAVASSTAVEDSVVASAGGRVELPFKAPELAAPPPTAEEPIAPATTTPPAPVAVEAAAVLPATMPPELHQAVTQALVDGSAEQAARILAESPARFQQREELIDLLKSVPKVETLVAGYLASRIGKPLLLEYNGRARTVIPRGIKDGHVNLEANGRAVDIALATLSPDDMLRWMERPQSEAERIAYCLVLMRSQRHHEVAAYMLSLPLVAPLVNGAARVVAEATQ